MVAVRRLRANRVAWGWPPLIGLLVVGLAGYFGPWVPHRAAGLVITGLDLAEYVKFLPAFAAGQLGILREAFYLPLAVGSLAASLLAARRTLPWPVRVSLAGVAIPLALAMLPPAWSPATLRLPEFRLQVLAIILCLGGVPLTVLTRYLPDRLVHALIALSALVAGVWPAWSFLQVRPAIAELYRAPLGLGWGFVACLAGYLACSVLSLGLTLSRSNEAR